VVRRPLLSISFAETRPVAVVRRPAAENLSTETPTFNLAC
jgi:hypothetical protein